MSCPGSSSHSSMLLFDLWRRVEVTDMQPHRPMLPGTAQASVPTLLDLPEDIICAILSLCSLPDRVQATSCCKCLLARALGCYGPGPLAALWSHLAVSIPHPALNFTGQERQQQQQQQQQWQQLEGSSEAASSGRGKLNSLGLWLSRRRQLVQRLVVQLLPERPFAGRPVPRHGVRTQDWLEGQRESQHETQHESQQAQQAQQTQQAEGNWASCQLCRAPASAAASCSEIPSSPKSLQSALTTLWVRHQGRAALCALGLLRTLADSGTAATAGPADTAEIRLAQPSQAGARAAAAVAGGVHSISRGLALVPSPYSGLLSLRLDSRRGAPLALPAALGGALPSLKWLYVAVRGSGVLVCCPSIHMEQGCLPATLQELHWDDCTATTLPPALLSATQLRRLRLAGSRHHGLSCSGLETLPHLTSLSLLGATLQELPPPQLAVMQQLEALDLSCARLAATEPAYGLLAQQPWRGLDWLSEAGGPGLGGPRWDWRPLEELTNLRWLSLAGCCGAGEVPAFLWRLPSLQALDFSMCRGLGLPIPEPPEQLAIRSLGIPSCQAVRQATRLQRLTSLRRLGVAISGCCDWERPQELLDTLLGLPAGVEYVGGQGWLELALGAQRLEALVAARSGAVQIGTAPAVPAWREVSSGRW